MNLSTLSSVELVLLGCIVVAAVYQCYYVLRYMTVALRLPRTNKETDAPTSYPGVSIVVCARNEAANLKYYLPTLLTQDYPTFEVIVVDDKSTDETHCIIERYAAQYSHLCHTFVPEQTKVFSTKKIAITLGIKAAQYDYVILTDANARPESKQWLRCMMQGFTSHPRVEVVLGTCAYFPKATRLSRWMDYDNLFSTMQYIGYAKAGHPYRGVGANIGYRRQLFFDQHGFRKQLCYRSGDDDLFIRSIATSHNTAVVCSPDSLVWKRGKQSAHEWLIQLRSHHVAALHYPFYTRVQLALEPVTRMMLYGVGVIALVVGSPLSRWIILALLVGHWLLHGTVMLVMASRLGCRQLPLQMPLFDICLPLMHVLPIGRKCLYYSKTAVYNN